MRGVLKSLSLALAVGLFLGACGGSEEAEQAAFSWTDVDTDFGGALMPEQAAYDVRFYDLDLAIDPEQKSIDGVLSLKALVLSPLDVFVLDLDDRLVVKNVELQGGPDPVVLDFRHESGRLWIELDSTYVHHDVLELAVAYGGQPREAPNPPWAGGFTWSRSASGAHWIGVSCQIDGADLWWPVKDHPSDEPDEGVDLHFTVPEDLVVASNGRFAGKVANGDGTVTHHWNVTTPINAYNVTFNAGPFVALQHNYASVSGRTLPATYWVLPEDVAAGRQLFPELRAHLRFLEESFGPYPFQDDKYSVVEAPYLAMEHQTVMTYGQDFGNTRMGFHYIALHELAHEWWGNLVSAGDWRDFWLHEGFDAYTEALYAGHLHGEAGYHEYIARFIRDGMLDNRIVAPFEPTSVRSVLDRYAPLRKGAMVLHSLRYLVGDEAFFEILRRQAYPKPGQPKLAGCSQCRNANSYEFIALAEQVSQQDLGWFFELYLRRPELPGLVIESDANAVQVSWDVPAGMTFPMPVEVDINGERSRHAVPTQGLSLAINPGDLVSVDPNFLILRQAKADPDLFGVLGQSEDTRNSSVR